MRPKSKTEQAIVAWVGATLIVVVVAIALDSSPWGVVGMLLLMLFSGFLMWADPTD